LGPARALRGARISSKDKGTRMSSVRQAVELDVEPICAFDHVAHSDGGGRRRFVERSIAEGNCFVVVAENSVVAYGVLEYSFYEQGFISMLYVDARRRRSSYAATLVRHMESVCRTDKLFTSTNLSNLPMQSLLANLEYKLSGVIHGLDENDPELVYLKLLR